MDHLDKEKTRRLLMWSKDKPQGPFKIDVELHRRCNLNCLSCSRRADDKFHYINEFSKTIEMPVEKWLEIIDQAAAAGVWEWHFAGGGDPPFKPEVTFPVLARVKKHDMFGILTTNGTNLPEHRIEELVQSGWDRIHFSIDGPDPETHNYLRQLEGAFERSTAAMRAFARIKKKYKTDKPSINMNTVLSIPNFKRLPDMVRLARELDVSYMFVEPLIIYSDWGRKLKLTDEQRGEFVPHLREAVELAKKAGIDSNFTTLDTNLDDGLIEKSSSMHEVVKEDMEKHDASSFLSVPCYDPWFHMTIKADGRVISCDVATDEGDSVRRAPLEEIWFGPYFEKHRMALRSKEIPEFCAQCNPSHTTQRRWLRKAIEEGL